MFTEHSKKVRNRWFFVEQKKRYFYSIPVKNHLSIFIFKSVHLAKWIYSTQLNLSSVKKKRQNSHNVQIKIILNWYIFGNVAWQTLWYCNLCVFTFSNSGSHHHHTLVPFTITAINAYALSSGRNDFPLMSYTCAKMSHQIMWQLYFPRPQLHQI